MVGAPARRLQVAYARSRGLSQRRACALLSNSRSSLHYESRREARDKPLMAAMTDLAETYPRFGYPGSTCSWNVWGMLWAPTRRSGYGPRPDCRYPGSGHGNESRHPVHDRNCRWAQTNCGRTTLSTTPVQTASRSNASPWWMNIRGRACL